MSDTSEQDFAAMSAAGEEHRKLKPFAGTFRAEVKIWMGPGEPAVTTGSMINEFDLDGRFLRQTYTGDDVEGPFPNFEGRGFWGYNKVTGEYEGVWIDNASTMMQTEAGGLDESGKVWTMVGEIANPQTGEMMTKKSIVRLHDDDHHTMEMYFESPDGETKGMEIDYRRTD